MNTVSVVIPTYNRINSISRAIDSVLKQTHPINQIIVVDNNSTDNTSEILKNEYSKIEILVEKKQGVSFARNKGIKYSNCDWVALLDSDDCWKPQKIEKQLSLYEKSKKKLRLVQGSHLVVKKIYDGDQAYILQLNDKRIIFMIPFKKKYTLIGTTDHEVEDFENPKITYEEKTYLINSVNSFIKNEIVDNDIVWTYSGVRPLIEDNNQKASKVSRDYAFEIDDRDGAPILTVFGGKLTTYRKLSEQVLKKLSKYIVFSNKTWTSDEVLPGATDINVNSENIPKEILERLIETYGAKISKLNEYYNEFNAGGDLIFEDFYEFEVKYLIKEEMARTSEDILFRRTKLGINFPKEAKDKLEIILKRHL